jgi:hypothetical protein
MGTQIAGSSVGDFELISADQEAHRVLKTLYLEDSIIDMNDEFAIDILRWGELNWQLTGVDIYKDPQLYFRILVTKKYFPDLSIKEAYLKSRNSKISLLEEYKKALALEADKKEESN